MQEKHPDTLYPIDTLDKDFLDYVILWDINKSGYEPLIIRPKNAGLVKQLYTHYSIVNINRIVKNGISEFLERGVK